MGKFLGTARTVDELLEMIEPYRGFDIVLHTIDYSVSPVVVYLHEEKKFIELV